MSRVEPRAITLVCLSILAIAALAADAPPGSTVNQLLVSGRYSEIPKPRDGNPRGHAAWALARFYLAPGREISRSAQIAHRSGDDLGTFVLMLCHQTGTGLAREKAEALKLNFQLRTKLEGRGNLSPLELYMLSQCQPGDEAGRLRDPDVEKLFAEVNRQRELAWQRLQKAANLGCAQACQAVALAQQDQAEAHRWHRKAADLGLAEGMRYAGIQLVAGTGVERDAAKGYELSLKAAKRGDVYAMVNLAVFHHRGMGAEKDQKQVDHWLEAAVASGHWYGCIEKGIAHFTGDYGCPIDRAQGVRLLQRAIESGTSQSLQFIATCYAKGVGLKQDGVRAVRFAEAAYRQGSTEAASCLAYVYTEGIGEIKPDQDRAGFWGRESAKPGLGFELMGKKERDDLVRSLDAIDPFALKVE